MAITRELRARIHDLEQVIEQMENSPEVVRIQELEAGQTARDELLTERAEIIETQRVEIAGLKQQVKELTSEDVGGITVTEEPTAREE